MPTKCVVCGEFFQKGNQKQKACSRRCNAIYQNKEKGKRFKCPICPICGKETRRLSAAKYCSMKCLHIAAMSSGNPMWKGGVNKKKDGYTTTLVYNHPFTDRNNRILTHRLVMENWLKENEPSNPYLVEIDGVKYLMNGVVVHHKNDIKDDNRIENLELLESQAKHLKKHNFLLDYRSIKTPNSPL
jgi:hypothetical protein